MCRISLLLMEETGLSIENLRSTDKLYCIMLFPVHLTMGGILTHNFRH